MPRQVFYCVNLLGVILAIDDSPESAAKSAAVLEKRNGGRAVPVGYRLMPTKEELIQSGEYRPRNKGQEEGGEKP